MGQTGLCWSFLFLVSGAEQIVVSFARLSVPGLTSFSLLLVLDAHHYFLAPCPQTGNKKAAWCCGRIEFRHLQIAKQENAGRTKTLPLHSKFPIFSAFHHQRHQLDQNILQRYMFGTTLNISTRLLVANSSCVSKGDWDRDVWKRLNAIIQAGLDAIMPDTDLRARLNIIRQKEAHVNWDGECGWEHPLLQTTKPFKSIERTKAINKFN